MSFFKNTKKIVDFINSFSKEEKIWMSGYIYGLLYNNNNHGKHVMKNFPEITICYGTVTGNAKYVANSFYEQLKYLFKHVKLINFDKYPVYNILKEKYILIIVSTHGEGNPPDSTKEFYDFLYYHKDNMQLQNLQYSVLALGDKSYKNFCKAGEDIDKYLYKMGGKRIINLHKCDVSYEIISTKWKNEILNCLLYKKKKCNIYGIIYKKELLTKQKLSKEIYHIEIIPLYPINYLPGDAIGIYPENYQQDVEKICNILKLQKNNIINELKNLDINNLSDSFINEYNKLYKIKKISNNLNLITLLNKYPINLEYNCILKLIKKLTPIKQRLYSISSSPKKHIKTIHLTIVKHIFKSNNNKNIKYGLCSNFITNLKKGEKIRLSLYKNIHFKLPNNSNSNIILICAGTGIAPFRSFLYEREILKCNGKNWLFFGNQSFYYDFLYKYEIERWTKNGIIYKLDCSFSRDQDKKIYIQNKIWDNRVEFFSWIKNGAYIYICGKKKPMSIEVHKTICKVIKEIGKENNVIDFINKMKKNGKYLKDVY